MPGMGLSRSMLFASAAMLPAPQLVAQAPPEFVSLTVGLANTCGITSAGVAYCWGDNSYGQIGDGTTARRTRPTPVAGDLRFRLVVIGGSHLKGSYEKIEGVHVCGLTLEGAAHCWGADQMGQLGRGGGANQRGTTPAPVATELRFTDLLSGLGYTCGLTAEGTASCWGAPGFRVISGVEVHIYRKPFTLASNLRFTGLFEGHERVCGLKRTGVGLCWRQEGAGRFSFSEMSRAQDTLRVITKGWGGALCGVDTGGAWSCWQTMEAIGNTLFTKPEVVVPGINITTVRYNNRHACGLAATGTLHCLGKNGDLVAAATPATGVNLVTLQASPGGEPMCGLSASGDALCWGGNRSGELGDGTNADRAAPMPVRGGLRFRAIAVGTWHSCGVTLEGATYCWGENDSGQLGDGSREDRNVPVPVGKPAG